MSRLSQEDIFKNQLEKLTDFGSIQIRKDIDEKYLVENKLLTKTELMWRRILLSATSKQTKMIWDFLLNPIKYGLYENELTPSQKKEIRRMLCKIDRVYLAQLLVDTSDPEHMNHPFRKILNHDWVYNRCREVERQSDGYLELWPRSHYKSVIANNLEIIQEHLINPKLTIIIITFEVAFASKSYDYVKSIYETNKKLKELFPEIFYQNAANQSPKGKWNSDHFWLKPACDSNSREPSLTYASIVKLPTGRHFQKRIYDDIVNSESVTSPQMIEKINQKISDSNNIGDPQGRINRFHMSGTRYHKNDSYQFMIDKKAVVARVYKATHNGKLDGKPVLLSMKEWEDKKNTEHSYIVACQMLMEPTMSEDSIFNLRTVKTYSIIRPMDIFILVDPATSKKKYSDYTGICVIGIDSNSKKYLLDGVRDKIDLNETWEIIKRLHKKWTAFLPGYEFSVHVVYEQYAASRDIESYKNLQDRDNYHFEFIKVSFGNDGIRSKKDRAMRLIPDLKSGSIFVPGIVYKNGLCFKWTIKHDDDNDIDTLSYEEVEMPDVNAHKRLYSETLPVIPLRKADYEGNEYDFTLELLDELESFPYGRHDDCVDSFSRLYDIPDLYNYTGGIVSAPKPEFIYGYKG